MKDIFKKAWKFLVGMGVMIGIFLSILIIWVAVGIVALCVSLF